MKKISLLLALALVAAIVTPAAAEVEEVTAGGSIHIRYQSLRAFEFGDTNEMEGEVLFNDDADDMYWGTQRTRINVDAQLTGNVRAFAEIQAFDFWGADWEQEGDLEADSFGGESFFGNFGAGMGNDNVQLYQAYIDMNDIGDSPLMVRVGRQELVYGREWVLGNNDAGVNFSGLAFDGVKASYNADAFKLDAWYTELENQANPTESDEDSITFMGVYGTYAGFENMALDGYFLWIYDDTGAPENVNLYTAGARLAGCWDSPIGLLDYNVEGAYQFGDTEDDGDFSAWAFNAMAGYTFDEVQMAPRLEAEYAYFSGDDDDDEDIDTFNRLFSDVHYGELNVGNNLDMFMTNMHIFRVGASIVPAERLTVNADFYYFMLADDEGDVLGMDNPSDDDEVGMELDLVADYQYTEDLLLRAGWAHFFADDAVENAFGEDDDVDYVFADAILVF
jgi:hypothetical protein